MHTERDPAPVHGMRRPTKCPHCFTDQLTAMRLDQHLRFFCPVLRPDMEAATNTLRRPR